MLLLENLKARRKEEVDANSNFLSDFICNRPHEDYFDLLERARRPKEDLDFSDKECKKIHF